MKATKDTKKLFAMRTEFGTPDDAEKKFCLRMLFDKPAWLQQEWDRRKSKPRL